MKVDTTKLAGNLAYDLFVSSEPFPCQELLDMWKEGKLDEHVTPSYLVAVLFAFKGMRDKHDGPRDGTYRPHIRNFKNST